ncbi:hypothetical protein FRACYDRAFT_235076 [Fragilariopsis cylindrus CCMP1102]|uniref:Uncharacterized protein n=1 Tax=Fragilariopsis cylindrus CCMP1102 TaxID=635003 RepID=A0A1E7FTH3_9STRA|nr:hypothetical protein FRACYDRAFT_235076 [Fragilariopsis cylindrus CCMP1102]|eukprot:OEU21449.1 hypothetical protein FRACYDRAFT_235076 [Fragilariopsis cylindrus CCMP1102]
MVQAHFFGPAPPPTIVDHRTFRRSPRKIYDHARAFYCIEQDYLGNNTIIPLFDGREFEQMFRISRARFQRLRMDIGASGDPFFVHLPVDTNGRVGASLDARLLLPIKSLAYGVPPHTFRDYFQMSTTLARDCYSNYNKIIIKIYKKEVMDGNVYARYVPTNSFDSPAAASSNIGRPGYDEDDDDSFLPIGIANAPIDVQRLLSRSERWQELQSLENYSRLNNAIINKFKE